MMPNNKSFVAKATEHVSRGRPRGQKQDKTRRYQLVLPEELYLEIQGIAEKEHTSFLEIIRKLLKYGLLVFNITKDPGTKLIIREGDSEREIVMI